MPLIWKLNYANTMIWGSYIGGEVKRSVWMSRFEMKEFVELHKIVERVLLEID